MEKQALKQGLKRSDVFCGTPYQIFTEVGSNFSSRRLGIPDDRAAILIYDSKKLQEVEDSEKMGFITQSSLKDLGIAENKVAVYFPLSYSLSGDLFIVPAENVKAVNVPSAEFMKFIISGGVTELDELTEHL